jgi:Type IV pilin-like G and H, putative
LFNRTQGHFILENGVFAKTFNELAIGTLQGGIIDSSKIFQYKLDIPSKDLAIIGAKHLDEESNGFNGAVLRYKNKKGFFALRSIMCESTVMGADGTNPKNSPIVNTSGKLICAAGWKVLREDNEEPSEQELSKLIQNKAKEEIERILREQNSIYYKQGKFVSQYSNIPQEKNRSLPKFNVKIRNYAGRAVVAIQNDSSEQDKYKISFGTIKLVRSKRAQPLSDRDREKNTILWHYLDTLSFLCTSDRLGTPLPKNKELDRVIDSCPIGYTKSSEREGGFNLVRHNLVTIRMMQEGYYEQHHKFMTDFAEFEKFAVDNSRQYATFIRVSQDPYQYNFRANGKQLVITAQPKLFEDPFLNTTYLRMSSATGTVKYWPHVYTYCESKVQNIPIPTDEDISKISLNQERQSVKYLENCPAGYTLIEKLE